MHEYRILEVLIPQLLVGVAIRELKSVGTRVPARNMFQMLVQIRTREADDAVFASEMDILVNDMVSGTDDAEGLLGPPPRNKTRR